MNQECINYVLTIINIILVLIIIIIIFDVIFEPSPTYTTFKNSCVRLWNDS